MGRRNTSRGSLLAVWPVADPWKPRASASSPVGTVLAPRQCAADRGERTMITASIGPLCQLGAATSPRFPGNAPSLASAGYSMPDSIAKLPKAGQQPSAVTGQRRGPGQQVALGDLGNRRRNVAGWPCSTCGRLASWAIRGDLGGGCHAHSPKLARVGMASARPRLATWARETLAGQGSEGLISHNIPYANRIGRHRQGMRARAGAFRAVYGTRATPPYPTHPPPGSTAPPIVPPTPTTSKNFCSVT